MSNKLFVGGLSWDTSDDSLRNAFQSFGNVREARVILDRETGRSRGFGFVTLGSPAEAEKAVEAMNGSFLDGRAIRVNVAEERPGGPRPGGPGGGPGGGGRRDFAPRPEVHTRGRPGPRQDGDDGGFRGPPREGGYGGPPREGGFRSGPGGGGGPGGFRGGPGGPGGGPGGFRGGPGGGPGGFRGGPGGPGGGPGGFRGGPGGGPGGFRGGPGGAGGPGGFRGRPGNFEAPPTDDRDDRRKNWGDKRRKPTSSEDDPAIGAVDRNREKRLSGKSWRDYASEADDDEGGRPMDFGVEANDGQAETEE